eukprot:CAMPEP_0172301544 /NCGR_PEP_ID=MMETSP1058-20130122/3406_1 /TAXON_ID=83371 /ORGANISM="Detonula confervacea, Strain CCMP 353" /LENGTH=133 /DNA_ID=CAMNT_0013011689 /DNA_START=130 /DNA_END=531 /DNA_ORIENTATION=+
MISSPIIRSLLSPLLQQHKTTWQRIASSSHQQQHNAGLNATASLATAATSSFLQHIRFFSEDSSPAPSPTPAAPAPSPPPAAAAAAEDSSRLHSTDIAFKPAESGWGGGNKYTKNYDSIFSSSSDKKDGDEEQ